MVFYILSGSLACRDAFVQTARKVSEIQKMVLQQPE